MEDEDASVTTDRPPSPKYTMSEKWMLERQKQKLLSDKMWALKQRKTEQRIAVCTSKLKVRCFVYFVFCSLYYACRFLWLCLFCIFVSIGAVDLRFFELCLYA